MPSAASSSSAASFKKGAQTADLFDFPTPPAQPPNHNRHSTLVPDPQSRASKRQSSAESNMQVHFSSAHDASLAANGAAVWMKGADIDGSGDCQERPVSGQYIANFKRLSKSTTSLPAMLSGYGFGIGDDTYLGDYQYYPGENESRAAGEKPAEAHLSQQLPPQHPLLRESRPRQLRAAKSHHNLQAPEDNGVLSQSMLSMASKVEPLLDVVDLLMPIECGSYEYDACKASTACATAYHAYAESDAPVADTPVSANMVDPCSNENCSSEGDAHSCKATGQSQKRGSEGVLQVDGPGYLVAEPMEPIETLAAPETSGDLMCNSGSSSTVRTRVASLMPRKQMSMAQLEARYKNRNSMLVSGALLPAVSPEVSRELSQQPRFQRDEADVQLEKRLRRASRYLYDVPNGGSVGNGMQGTLSKAFHWPQRIGRSTSRRAEKTKSTVIDQYKIYDIYEESIWHSTHTAGAGIDISGGYGFGLNSGGSGGAADHFAARKPSAISLGGFKTLRSVASSPGLLRLRMAKAQKSSSTSRSREAANWNRSDTVYSSDYTDSDGDSDSESSVVLSEAHKQSYPKDAPVRKSSSIHLFVKKASLSLIRRSVSFCKSVSGAGRASSPAASASSGAFKMSEGFDGVMDMRSQAPEKVVKPKRSYRFATAVRHAGSRLRETLRSADKKRSAENDDDSDIVSAYPTDSMPRCDLDSYLSTSAHHSPSMTTPTNSTTVCDDDGNDTDDGSDCAGDGACSKSGRLHATNYVPPKRPPFLGLHRKSIAGDVSSGDANGNKQTPTENIANTHANVNVGTGHVGAPNNAAFVCASGVPARLRPTQFNSAFTTLPYGAYAQMSQLRGQPQQQQQQQQPFNGHM